MAEAVVRLLGNQPEAGSGIDAASRQEDTLRPQANGVVTRLSSEGNQLIHQVAADAEPASIRLDQKQPQFGDAATGSDQEHTADRLTQPLSDPTALALRIEMLDEFGDDAGD